MAVALTHPSLSLRMIAADDAVLLKAIYASTREKEMQLVPYWTAAQKEAFLLQQFTAQHVYYQQHYPGADFCILEAEGIAIGRLYIDKNFTDGSIRIIDITILPLYQNKGYGESILRDIMNTAAATEKSITIHVESFNPALQLYERLGFRLKDRKNNVYYLLEWKAAEAAVQPC